MADQTDVLIVGASPVGLLLACELQLREIDCRVIEKYAHFPATSRANALQPRAVEVLNSLGVADQIAIEGYPAQGTRIMRGRTEIARLETDAMFDSARRLDRPYRGIVYANQAVVEKALRDKLVELGGRVERQRGPRSGDRAPDGALLDSAGKPAALFAQFRAPEFRLLIFQGRRRTADSRELAAIGHRVHAASDGLVRPIVITTDNTSGPDDEVLVLRDQKWRSHAAYGVSSPSMFLIRPDGYIGFRCRTSDEAELVDYLQRHFGLAVPAAAETVRVF